MKKFADKNRYTVMLFVFMAIVLIFFTVTKGGTLWSLGTWKGIVMQFPEFGVMTIGLMFCFITGNMDMSFVALGDFATVMGVRLMKSMYVQGESAGNGMGAIIAGICLVMVICAAGGWFNGILVTKLGIPPVMATISMQLVWQGLSTALTGGDTVTGLPAIYTEIGHGNVLGFIPYPLFIFILVFIFAAFLIKCTVYGQQIFMIGTNVKACKYSALNTDAINIATYMLCSMICGIGCLLMVNTMASAKADYGTSYLMRCILILVLAGVLPDGGMGKIFDVLLAVIIVQIIGSGVNMFTSLNPYHASFIWGGLLIVVLILSTRMTGGGSSKPKKVKKEKAAA